MDDHASGAGLRNSLRSAYLENPCQVLANALWKTAERLPHARVTVAKSAGTIHGIEVREEDRLVAHWWRDRSHRVPGDLSDLSMALLHADFATQVPSGLLQDRSAFFRLYSTGVSVPRLEPVTGIRLVDVQSGEEAQVASFLQRCYPGLRLSADAVAQWRLREVFDSRLWIWAVRETDRRRVGLGIAERDVSIGEGSLEWIQVLPEARQLGLASALVRELTSRLLEKCRFVTVSGRVTDDGAAERLYRRCGFAGSDVWWLMRRLPERH